MIHRLSIHRYRKPRARVMWIGSLNEGGREERGMSLPPGGRKEWEERVRVFVVSSG
jgi:hypothetical protein